MNTRDLKKQEWCCNCKWSLTAGDQTAIFRCSLQMNRKGDPIFVDAFNRCDQFISMYRDGP